MLFQESHESKSEHIAANDMGVVIVAESESVFSAIFSELCDSNCSANAITDWMFDVVRIDM